jgi:predicted metal-binding membrane protein
MTTTGTTVLEAVLRRDRIVVVAALVSVISLSWIWIVLGAGTGMTAIAMTLGSGMPGVAAMLMETAAWSPGYAGLMFAMWWVMMAAMMLPSAAPTVLLVTTLASDRTVDAKPLPVTAMLFASGYLLVWCGFSVAATLLQWGLDEAGLLSETMAFDNGTAVGAVLIAVGIYEWTPLKDACLRHCRSPTEFLVRHWRQGAPGAVLNGMRHGLFCLGCCWLLMALPFVGGLMNLAWIAAIALLVLLEKTIPRGEQIGLLAGALSIEWGLVSLIRAGFAA